MDAPRPLHDRVACSFDDGPAQHFPSSCSHLHSSASSRCSEALHSLPHVTCWPFALRVMPSSPRRHVPAPLQSVMAAPASTSTALTGRCAYRLVITPSTNQSTSPDPSP